MYELLSIWFSVNKLPTKVERQVLKNYIKAWKKVIIIHEKWNQNLSEKVSDENWLTLPIKKISSLKWVSVNVQSNLCWLIWLPPILDRYLKEREKLHKLFSIQRTHKIQEWSQLIRWPGSKTVNWELTQWKNNFFPKLQRVINFKCVSLWLMLSTPVLS